MCNRISLLDTDKIREFIATYFDVAPELTDMLMRSPNLSPTELLPVIRRTGINFEYEPMIWGYQAGSMLVTNARDDSLLTKALFKTSAQKRRCVVVADGFYEWQTMGRTKVPHHFFLKGHVPFALAGLYEDASVGPRRAMLVTTEPNSLLEAYHNRMPAILDRERAKAWLSDVPLTADNLRSLCVSYPAGLMEEYRVDSRMSNSRYKGDDAAEPWKPADGELELGV